MSRSAELALRKPRGIPRAASSLFRRQAPDGLSETPVGFAGVTRDPKPFGAFARRGQF